MTRHIGRTLLVAIVIATWLPVAAQLAPESVALGMIALLPFAAPGAMIGVALGWVSHAFRPDVFTWRRGRTSALLGALLVPPWLAALVTITGMTIAGGVAIIVVGAWVVLIGGVGIGIGRWIDACLTRRPHRAPPSWMRFVRIGSARGTRSTQRVAEMFDQGVLTREDIVPGSAHVGIPPTYVRRFTGLSAFPLDAILRLRSHDHGSRGFHERQSDPRHSRRRPSRRAFRAARRPPRDARHQRHRRSLDRPRGSRSRLPLPP